MPKPVTLIQAIVLVYVLAAVLRIILFLLNQPSDLAVAAAVTLGVLVFGFAPPFVFKHIFRRK